VKRPRVSVITPAYNAENTIASSVLSVLNQSYRDIELIIIVNGCTDRTEEVATALAERHSRIRILHSKKGKVPSRNLGLLEARGEIIALNDADDIWLPGKLDKQVKAIDAGYDVVAGRIECIDCIGKIGPDPLNRPTKSAEIVASMLCGINPIANSAAVFRKGLIDDIGTYDDCFPFCEDYHFWLRAIKFAKFTNLDDVVVRYFVHESPGYDHEIPKALASFYAALYRYTGVVR
jgi:glycosyltransferase involved in cell wall biosynthesis